MPQPRRATVTFILVVLLLDTLGIGVVIPVLPRLIESMVSGDLAQASRTYGLFVSVYAVAAEKLAPVTPETTRPTKSHPRLGAKASRR